MASNCFICSLNSYDFERHTGGFQTHVKEEHSMWAYLKFFMHLKRKRRNEYSANEYAVAKHLAIVAAGEAEGSVAVDPTVDETACFPINRSLSIIKASMNNVRLRAQCMLDDDVLTFCRRTTAWAVPLTS